MSLKMFNQFIPKQIDVTLIKAGIAPKSFLILLKTLLYEVTQRKYLINSIETKLFTHRK